MLIRQLIINRYVEALQEEPKLHYLLEDAGQALMTAVKVAKADLEKAEKLDLEELADIITAIKLLTNSDYRSVMTKQEVGIDPNNAAQLLKMLDSVPSDPSKALPGQAKTFFKSVALMSKSLRQKELDSLKLLTSKNQAERGKAQENLSGLATKVIQAIDKLKQKVKA